MIAPLLGFFILGTLFGLAIDRAALAIPARRRIVSLPGCPHCGLLWAGIAVLPLIGPLLARRCARCDAPISALRPVTEAVTGILFALTYWRFGLTSRALATAAFIVVLLLILRIDWTHHAIYPTTIYAGLLLAIGFAAILPGRPDALLWTIGAAMGAALAFLLLYALALAIYRRRALGFGDVLLAALIGAMAGPATARALLLGMLLAAVGGLLLVVLRVRTMRDYIPYGAYLCAGTIVALLVG